MRISRLGHLLSTLLLLLPILALSLSTELTILIPSTSQLPQAATLPPSTTASLTTLSATYSAHLSSQNSFHFRNVSAPGSYLLSISCATHAFPPLRVDVSADGTVEAWRTIRGNEWENKGEEFNVGEGNVLEVKALGGKAYYMKRQGCEFFFFFSFFLLFSIDISTRFIREMSRARSTLF